MSGEVSHVEVAPPEALLERLGAALESEEEYPRERDLFSYVFLLGLALSELDARPEDDPEQLYQELADYQGAYARLHHSLAEAARDDQTGRMINSALRREVAATREYLIPRLESERERLGRRREALRMALAERRRRADKGDV
ncbi:MAG: hypothetical protein K6T51_01115 [Rubrobacteraceae bacterium]|uniref:hypothetical protein n=1 Tax=Rubrobacter TaxID=42255 RepID=UPI0023618486|nr:MULTISPECIES: hypothetical protein [Rubrobacter]MBX6762178.1 hypothetical protein [Rubrobacteraceae bacterium]MCL6437182.1 hypothetical protein [Rubrobacteraceae bacterium]